MTQPLSNRGVSRRKVLLSGTAFGTVALAPGLSMAQSTVPPNCAGIFAALERARGAYSDAGSWSISVAPEALARLETASKSLRQDIAAARNDASEAKWALILNSTNALASGVIYTLGVTGSVAAAPLYIATIATSGVFLIAQAATVPTQVTASNFVITRALDQLDGLLSFAGADSAVLSHNAVKYSSQAGNLMGALNILFQVWAAFDAGKTFQEKTALANLLKEALHKVEVTLSHLQAIEARNAFRQACARGLGEDLDATYGLMCTTNSALD